MATKTRAPSFGTIWDSPQSWTPAGTPGAADDAVIGAAAVQVFGQAQAHSLTLADPAAALSVGLLSSLSVMGSLAVDAGTLTLGGTLSNATFSFAAGTLTYQGGTFDNVTLASPFDLGALEPGVGLPSAWFQHTLTLATPGTPGLRLTAANSSLSAAPFGEALSVLGDAATLDGGIAFIGSPVASAPASLRATDSDIVLGAGLGLDVVGAAALVGAGYGVLGRIANAGTIKIAPGGSLAIDGAFSSTGAIHVASGTLDLSNAPASVSIANPVIMDDSAGKLILTAGQSIRLDSFQAGDTIDVKRTGATATVTQGGPTLAVGGGTITFSGALTPGSYTMAPDGSGGTLITTTAASVAVVFVTDQTTGASGTRLFDAAAGGPSYLEWQYIDSGPDTSAIGAFRPNVFLHGGTGQKSMAASSGRNVLDGGTGSAFLTGGTGTDTFFVDARNTIAVWDTIRNFHAGDAVTIWGWVPGVSSFTVDASAGAPGYEGATLRIHDVLGGAASSVTFTGMTAAQVSGFQQAGGTQGAGTYLYLYNPGV